MIYIKNNTEIQTIFIPRTELESEAYNTTIKTYEDGYNDGFGEGKQYQKDQLLNLYITENGEYEREDGWGVVTVDIPMGECPEGGSCNLGVGEVLLDTTMTGTYELNASDDGYDGWEKFIVILEGGSAIKVHKAEELIQMFNEGGHIDFGAYYYVGGKITEIEEVNTQYGNATYVLDNGFKIYRGDWLDGSGFYDENQIKVGAYIVVYGIIQDYRGQLQFKAHSQVIAYQEFEGGEIVSCNLEEIGISPSMGDRDGNGVIVVSPNEGFDGLSRVVIDPQNIYNEGVTAGKAEGGDLNIDAVSTSLGVGDWSRWIRVASDFGLDGMSEITIDGSQYQEWTKAYTLLQAYQNTEEAYITDNGEYRPNIGYDGFALKGYNVAWVIDVVPTIDTDVEIWVKPYEEAPNSWQGFIGSQVNDDDNTTFQIRRRNDATAFEFRFGENSFDYPLENGRWYRLRMNRNGVWVNGEQVCGWDVQAFEENPNPLMINGIYNLGFDNENYRMNHSTYGYVHFHNTNSLLVPSTNGLFIGNENRTIARPFGDSATLEIENNWYPNGYTKVVVDVQNEDYNIQEYKWVRPSMADRADNGDIYIYPDEGFDAVGYIDFDPSDIYNEGVEDGKNQSGDCNLQHKTVELDGERMGVYPDEGYDGLIGVIIEAGRKAEEWREEGRNETRRRLQSIEITENGRYSNEDQIIVNSLRYNGGYHTDTISTYDINRIEVTFKADTSESINGQAQPFILGGSMWGLNESGEDNECARAIQYAYGRIVGYWEGKWTDAMTTMDGEWLTITLDENGMNVKYPSYENYMEYAYDNGNRNSGGDIFPFIIGGLGRRKPLEDGTYSASLIGDSQFRGLIKEVKINTNSMGEITYIPKNWGYGVWDRIVENTGEYLSALEPTEGEITMNSEWESKYGEGWKEINVNVQCVCPSVQEQVNDFYYCPITVGDSGFGERAKNFSVLDETMISNDEGILYSDKYIYLPSSNNKNVVKTKVKVDRMVFPFEESDSMYMGKIWVDGVGTINFNGLYFNNLYYLETSVECGEIKLTNCTLTNLNTLIIKSAYPLSYDFRGTIFKDGGVLKVNANLTNAEEIRAALGSGWTIEYL